MTYVNITVCRILKIRKKWGLEHVESIEQNRMHTGCWLGKPKKKTLLGRLNLLAPELFFLILAHTVYKM